MGDDVIEHLLQRVVQRYLFPFQDLPCLGQGFLVHFCCEARFTHSVVAPEILDRYCQHDSPHQGGLSPPLAGG